MHKLLCLGALVFGMAWPLGCRAVGSSAVTRAASTGSLPTPPMQHEAWVTPEASAPQEVIEATGQLYQQGLADPRGCEYREVQVPAGCDEPDGSAMFGPPEQLMAQPLSPQPRSARELVTHGWVLPTTAGGQPYAVCWNGLVYPVHRLGPPADLRADVSLRSAPCAASPCAGGVIRASRNSLPGGRGRWPRATQA